jgi:ketosteroid isomerase-like protein
LPKQEAAGPGEYHGTAAGRVQENMLTGFHPVHWIPHSKSKMVALEFLFDSQRKSGITSDTHMRTFFRVRTSLSAMKDVGGLFFLLAAWLWLAPQSAMASLPHHGGREAHKEIEALEMQWRQAQLNNDVSVMDRLLAEDYIGISANGTIETKAEALALRRAGTLHITSLDLNDMKVRIYGDTAVVTSRADLTGTNGSRDISGKYRYTRVYNRRLGQWKIVSFEASRMHDAGEREKH